MKSTVDKSRLFSVFSRGVISSREPHMTSHSTPSLLKGQLGSGMVATMSAKVTFMGISIPWVFLSHWLCTLWIHLLFVLLSLWVGLYKLNSNRKFITLESSACTQTPLYHLLLESLLCRHQRGGSLDHGGLQEWKKPHGVHMDGHTFSTLFSYENHAFTGCNTSMNWWPLSGSLKFIRIYLVPNDTEHY